MKPINVPVFQTLPTHSNEQSQLNVSSFDKAVNDDDED